MKSEYDVFVSAVKKNLKNNKITMKMLDAIAKDLGISNDDLYVYVYYLFGKEPFDNNDVFTFTGEEDSNDYQLSSASRYYKDNSRFKPLSRNEEIYYAKLSKNGDKKASEVLLMSNMKFVLFIARIYSNRYGVSMEDMAQEGAIALSKAIENYDYKYGRLLSYGYHYISRNIERAIKNKYTQIRIPINLDETCSKIGAYYFLFHKNEGRVPTIDEIADHFNITSELAKKYCDISLLNNVVYMDTPIETDEGEYTNSLATSLVDKTDPYKEVEFNMSMASDVKKAICGDVLDKYSDEEINNIINFCKLFDLKKNILKKSGKTDIDYLLNMDKKLSELRLLLPKYEINNVITKNRYSSEYLGLKRFDFFVKAYGIFGSEKKSFQEIGDEYCTSKQFVSQSNLKTLETVKSLIKTKYPEYKRMLND